MGQTMMKTSTTIFGLTGNIATGKSVVRRMLVNCGAFGIDADVVAHRMLYPGAPAYNPVINAFGKKILNEDGQISRKALGQIVFSDPDSLKTLEDLVHPAVDKAIRHLIARADQDMIVIEAIKLFEAGLDKICDTVWVSHASQDVQMERLLQTRHMNPKEARTRIAAQPSQSEKLNRASVVINTEGSFRKTWEQVQENLNVTMSAEESDLLDGFRMLKPGQMDSNDLTAFLDREQGEPGKSLYEWLGTMAHLVILQAHAVKALVSWLDWNFTATLKRIITGHAFTAGLPLILQAFEDQARSHQCEVGLSSTDLAQNDPAAFITAGFQNMAAASISHPAWHQAAEKCLEDQQNVWVKVLTHPFELEAIETHFEL
jgi:dephospho-CoA kinase